MPALIYPGLMLTGAIGGIWVANEANEELRRLAITASIGAAAYWVYKRA